MVCQHLDFHFGASLAKRRRVFSKTSLWPFSSSNFRFISSIFLFVVPAHSFIEVLRSFAISATASLSSLVVIIGAFLIFWASSLSNSCSSCKASKLLFLISLSSSLLRTSICSCNLNNSLSISPSLSNLSIWSIVVLIVVLITYLVF